MERFKLTFDKPFTKTVAFYFIAKFRFDVYWNKNIFIEQNPNVINLETIHHRIKTPELNDIISSETFKGAWQLRHILTNTVTELAVDSLNVVTKTEIYNHHDDINIGNNIEIFRVKLYYRRKEKSTIILMNNDGKGLYFRGVNKPKMICDDSLLNILLEIIPFYLNNETYDAHRSQISHIEKPDKYSYKINTTSHNKKGQLRKFYRFKLRISIPVLTGNLNMIRNTMTNYDFLEKICHGHTATNLFYIDTINRWIITTDSEPLAYFRVFIYDDIHDDIYDDKHDNNINNNINNSKYISNEWALYKNPRVLMVEMILSILSENIKILIDKIRELKN